MTPRAKLNCWQCNHLFDPSLVQKDSTIRGRHQSLGGPFRSYCCPKCGRNSRLESPVEGEVFISPESKLGFLDYLFGSADSEEAKDYLKVLQWQQKNLEYRKALFESKQDFRYSTPSKLNQLKLFLANLIWPASRQKRGPSQEKKPSLQVNREFPINPNYERLGLKPNASRQEVKKAFSRLVKAHHPDKLRNANQKELDQASKNLNKLIQAYENIMSE